MNGSIFRKPVRTQGATRGTNKGKQRLAGHILRLLACSSFGFTHRIFAITPHLSACERESGASEILARGAIGSGVPRSGGEGGSGGGSSDPWSASAAQSCQVLLPTKGWRRGDCDGGVAHRVTLAPHSRPPGVNPAVGQLAEGTGAEPWWSLTPIPPLQDTRFTGPRPRRAPAGPGGVTHKDRAKLSSSRASIAAAASTRGASGPVGLLPRARPWPSLRSAS